MTDEELIAALRVEVPFALFNGTQDDWDAAEVKLQAAADRLEALTQPSGKVSDEQLRRGKEALQVLNRRKMTCAEIAKVVLEAAQLPARPVVKALRWTVSEVFGARKIRGSGPFGEWCAFTIDGLTDQEVSEKKAKYQAGYERTILSAMEGEGHE